MNILLIVFLLTLDTLLIGYILYKTGLFPKWTAKRRIKNKFPIPINPNTNQRPCQFCGILVGVQLSQDGYYTCPSCKVLRLNQTA